MSYPSDELSPYKAAMGMIYLVLKNAIFSISAGILMIFIARSLTVSELGVISGLQAVVSISVILAILGLPGAATRFMSSHIGKGRQDKAKAISKLVFIIGLVSSTVFSFGLYIFSSHIAVILFHEILYYQLIQLASIDVFLISMITFSSALIYALQRFKTDTIFSIINSILKLVLSIGLLMSGVGLKGIIIGWISADLVYLLMFVYVLMPHLRGSFTYDIRSLFSYSLPLYGSTILDYLAVNIDRYLLLILSGILAVGIYSPALSAGSVFFMILTSLDNALLPYFSRLYAAHGSKSLNELSRYASRYIFLVFFPIGFGGVALVPNFLILIYGDKYAGSIYPSIIIIVAITLTSIGTLFNNILMSSGHTNIFFKSTAISLCVQIGISLISIPYIGALGAAFAKALSYVALFVYPVNKLKKMEGIHYDRNAMKKGLAGSLIMALILYTLNSFLPNIYYIPFNLVIAFLSYLLFIRFTHTMNVQDFETLNNVMSGRLRWPIAMLSKVAVSSPH
jgi:O-antigen/teichoic acid export membrane protein